MTAEQINHLGSYAAFGVLGLLLIAVIVGFFVSRSVQTARGPNKVGGTYDHEELFAEPLFNVDGTPMTPGGLFDVNGNAYGSTQ